MKMLERLASPLNINLLHKPFTKLTLKGFSRTLRIERMGWDEGQLLQLVHMLQTVIRNFNRLSRKMIKIKVYLHKQHPENADKAYAIDRFKGEICVYLKPGPIKALQQARLGLIRELVDFLMSFPVFQNIYFTGLNYIPEVREKIRAGIAEMYVYYSKEGGLPLGISMLEQNFIKLSVKYGLEILKHKMHLSLLHRYSLSGEEIMAGVRSEISRILKEVLLTRLNSNDIVARLAMLSILAQKNGNSEIALKCQNELSGELGERLAFLNMKSAGITNLEYFERNRSLLLEKVQKQQSEFRLLFDLFRRTFESYYDGAEGRVKFSILYADKSSGRVIQLFGDKVTQLGGIVWPRKYDQN